jgi:tetratricopeptide (TPR) repeat protein
MSLHQYDAASTQLQKALEIDLQLYQPEHIELMYSRVTMGIALLKSGRAQEAIAPLQLAFELNRKTDIGYYPRMWLATAQWQAGLLADAERNFQAIIASGREKDAWTMIPARHRYGLLLLARGELAAAETLMERAASDAPAAYGADNPVLHEMAAERANLWLAQGKSQKVQSELPAIIAMMQKSYGDAAPPVKKAQALLAQVQRIAAGKTPP